MLDLFTRTRRAAGAVPGPRGGDMGARVRVFDWGRTALGPSEAWSPALHSAIRTMLASPVPACLWWGDERVTLMNDACAHVIGPCNATSLGMPAPAAWRELWPEVAVHVDRAFATGEGWALGPLALPAEHEGHPVEAHFRLVATPLEDGDGRVAGLGCTFADVTPEVVARRQMEMLGRLAPTASDGASWEAACRDAVEALGSNAWDFPFAAVHVVEPAVSGSRVVACTGIEASLAATLALPVEAAAASGAIEIAALPEAPFGAVPAGPWSRPPQVAIARRLASLDGGGHVVWCAALNPFRPFDEGFRRFVELVAAQVAARLALAERRPASQVESLEKLHALALKLGGMTEERPAMDAILETAVTAQGACSGFVWLQDPATGELVVRASRGFEGERAHIFSRVPAGSRGGGAGNAFAQGRRWVVTDTESDPLFEPYREHAARAGFRAVHSTPIITRSGELLGVLSVHFPRPWQPTQRDQQVADVCARHAADAIEALRSQEALRESERLYRAIGESIDYGVWTADAEGRYSYASDAFLRLVGIGNGQWAGAGWREHVHPDDVPALMEAWRDCVRTGRQLDQEFRVRCADGTWRTILGRGVPVRNEHGAVVAWAGINLDIQRLKQVEDDLRQHDRRKDEFLATLAHELRNPLAPLRNGLEVLRLAGGNVELAAKARGMMQRQLVQMVRLIDDLLDVSRVSRGKIDLRREKVELATVLRNAMETSQPLMNERGHDVGLSLPPGSIVVDADVTRLSQVFWNLLNNAAKYTEPGGRIDIGVRVTEGKVVVGIRDNGIGIPPEMQSRVFDIFTQVDRSLEKSQGGLGIGLSIAKRLVEMHGGTIRVKSEGHRKGSEFVVTLPAVVATAARDSRGETGAWPRLNGPSRRVLVADDNADSAMTLGLMLETLGNEVRIAHDGEEAFAAAAEFRPDVILLDIGMPKLSGYGACEMIRAQPWGREPYIVALTGWGQDEDKTRSKAAGFDRHLVKPVEPATIGHIVSTLPARAAA